MGWNASRPPPSPYLTGNYGPVHDTLRAGNLPILNYPAASFTSAAGVGSSAGSSTTAYGAATANGVLPEGLPDGYYVRAGPNPYHKPAAGYHWFDGDGERACWTTLERRLRACPTHFSQPAHLPAQLPAHLPAPHLACCPP